MALTIDVVSDVVCPWCFIGKRRLEEALALYAHEHADAEPPKVIWRAFQLNPGLPPEGVNRTEYYRQKFGDRVGEIVERVRGVGREVGIDFRFEAIERQPNTLAAHALIEHAADEGKQDAAVEALFRAFFLDGVDLTDPANLRAVAAAAGLSAESVDDVLASEEARAHIASEDAAARKIGVQGVPFFIFNRRLAVSGAQPAEVLVEAMRQAEAGD
ncbi:MAG: DsbA family oxidoreductase [Burkholderiales bacterium]|jgi:predicted DsbA family dithiol-disulfide isomerase|nr:DsbA family oxidoreductase [Burkholderiales bacterium]